MDAQSLFCIQYGMYVVSSLKDDKNNGQIANVVFQVQDHPFKIAVCISKRNLTYEYIKVSGIFGVSILEVETLMELIGIFGFRSGRDINKFKDYRFDLGVNGCPLLIENTLSIIEAEVVDSMDLGSHVLFVGEVVCSKMIKDGSAMTYEYYHKVKKGITHGNAPTYQSSQQTQKTEIKEEIMKKEKGQSRYICDVCGYVYEPEKGDPVNNVEPGTPFGDLTEDYLCPICGVGIDRFTVLE
ncbi:MAG: flavin reductase [Planctomycetes bacterium]|nr:flavin reductase [Planctomycetota bacterium]